MVHQYKLNGCNIVLDTCSGSVHTVDDVAYDIIALYKEQTPDAIVSAMLEKYGDRPDVTEEDLRVCLEDVKALEEAGKLYTPDTFEPMAFDFKNRSTVVKALCLHVAHTCNLNCSYCFASQGKYHGDRALMSFEVGKRALDFLIEHSGTRVNLEVDFFGGEPLMNWDVVKQLVSVRPDWNAAAAACALLGICGQLAETPKGSGSFLVNLFDALSMVEDSAMEDLLNMEEIELETI